MKKTYKNPTMMVVKIQARQQIMTGSTTISISETNYNGTDEIQGRGFDFDDEE